MKFGKALAQVTRIDRDYGGAARVAVTVELHALSPAAERELLEWAIDGFNKTKLISLKAPLGAHELAELERNAEVVRHLQEAGVKIGSVADAHPLNILAALLEKAGIK